MCIYVGSRPSETNLDNEDYNDDYLADNQTESDMESIIFVKKLKNTGMLVMKKFSGISMRKVSQN